MPIGLIFYTVYVANLSKYFGATVSSYLRMMINSNIILI